MYVRVLADRENLDPRAKLGDALRAGEAQHGLDRLEVLFPVGVGPGDDDLRRIAWVVRQGFNDGPV